MSIVVSNGQVFYVSGTAEVYSTEVYAGGELFVYDSGFASGTVLSGGMETVWSGGTDYYSSVYSGGIEYAYDGGISYFTNVYSGGQEWIGSGGYVSAANISSGGAEDVYGGGQDKYTNVSSGGIQTVYLGGVATSAVVYSLRPFERRQRLGVPPLPLQRDSERKLRLRIVGILRSGPAEKVDRPRQIAGAQPLQPLLTQRR